MTETAPPIPRRAFLAATLAAVSAGGAVALGLLGQADVPEGDSFRFSRGTSFTDGEEARLRGFLARAAQDDRMVVIITGHTGTQGDGAANIELSQSRADAAATLARTMGVADDNILASGAGGGAPLPKPDGMGDRAYQSSLARVDVALQVRR